MFLCVCRVLFINSSSLTVMFLLSLYNIIKDSSHHVTLEQYLSKSIIALSLPFLLGTWAAITKYYKLVVLYHRNLFSHSSGGCKFRTRVPAWSTSAEGPLSGLQMTAFLHHSICVFTWRRERENLHSSLSSSLIWTSTCKFSKYHTFFLKFWIHDFSVLLSTLTS